MRLRSVQRRCEQRLRELELPRPLTVATLCRRIELLRGRPMRLLAMPPEATAAGELCGLWVATADADLVFTVAGTSRLHRHAIVLHELAHMICGHDASLVLAQDQASALAPDVRSDVVESMLGRAGYASEQEREAELMGSLLLTLLDADEDGPPRDAPVAADADVLLRLSRVLGAPR